MQHGLEQGVARGAREKTREASRRVIVMGVSIAQSPQSLPPYNGPHDRSHELSMCSQDLERNHESDLERS